MSSRAAWRLERMGFNDVYDYVAGKADWMAAGLPTVRAEPKQRLVDALSTDVATCSPDDRAADVLQRLKQSDRPFVVVVNEEQIILGRALTSALSDAEGPVEDAMEPGPTTVRADDELAPTLERMRHHNVRHLLVSTPDGKLLGMVSATG